MCETTHCNLLGASPVAPAVDALHAAVRRRRCAEAAYGRALTQVDLTLSNEQRDTLYVQLRGEIAGAQAAIEGATVALIAAMEGGH